MATKEEIDSILDQLKECYPKTFFSMMDNTNMGIGYVLKYLAITDKPVSAGEISGAMKVSTARVAVLLKKMTDKDLIIKESDPHDARKTIISLSENGHKIINGIKKEREDMMSSLIDKVGLKRIEEFIEISNEIRIALSEEINNKK